jgi:hypothetical protein
MHIRYPIVSQIKRLQNFCELGFFSQEKTDLIEEKIQKGTMNVDAPSPGGNPAPSPGGN